MLARIFDAFNDPFMGVVVAKTKSKYGRYKPWILSGALLNAFILFAMFSVPKSLTPLHTKWYITVTYFLCGITYTLSDIPFWSIIPATTYPGKERESMTVLARTFSGIGAALPTIITMGCVGILSFSGGYRLGFKIYAAIIAVIYVITTIISVLYLPNKEISEPSELSTKELLSALIHNDHAMILSLVVILYYSAIYLSLNLLLYVFQYDLGSTLQYNLFMAYMGVAQFLSMVLFYPTLRKRYTNRQIFLSACVVCAIGYLCFVLFLGCSHINFLMLLVPGFCIGYGNGIAYTQVTIFVASAVDYGEKKTGRRDNSVVSSIQTLIVKFSSAIGVYIAGVGIDMIGITQSNITHRLLIDLRLLFSLPSLFMVVVAGFIFYYKHDLAKEDATNV